MLQKSDMWNALRTRNPRFDGKFVYAVRTTRIFCRPSCGSRMPLMKNVEFFASPSLALLSGYRACKRCEPVGDRASVRAVVKACRLLESGERLSSSAVARATGVSEFHLARLFKAELGVSMQAYARRVANERAKRALSSQRTVTEAIGTSQISSSSRFYERLGPELGMSSRAATRRGAGVDVFHASLKSPLGCVFVAWTQRGVCHVALGDTPATLLRELETRLPQATFVAQKLCPWRAAVLDAARGRRHSAVPLHMQGTAFQERVWQALRKIPRGQTRSYGELAKSVRAPGAARAVGTACANNTIALLVPCHRAVRSDGSLSAYRWGIDRKEAILLSESEQSR